MMVWVVNRLNYCINCGVKNVESVVLIMFILNMLVEKLCCVGWYQLLVNGMLMVKIVLVMFRKSLKNISNVQEFMVVVILIVSIGRIDVSVIVMSMVCLLKWLVSGLVMMWLRVFIRIGVVMSSDVLVLDSDMLCVQLVDSGLIRFYVQKLIIEIQVVSMRLVVCFFIDMIWGFGFW